ESRLLGDTDQHFDAAADHWLDENLAQPGPEGAGQRPVPAADVLLAAEAELDTAGVALVHEPGHVRLEGEPPAEPGSGLNRPLLAGDRPGGDQGDPVAGQEAGRFRTGQPAAVAVPG